MSVLCAVDNSVPQRLTENSSTESVYGVASILGPDDPRLAQLQAVIDELADEAADPSRMALVYAGGVLMN